MTLPRLILPGDPFRLGVNYWPRRKAMYWWSDFDRGEVRDDFALLEELGLDLIRIFLLWEDWQPAPDRVDPGALRHLEVVCDLAEDHGLLLDVTFFVGHMSGPNWAPAWLLDRSTEPPPHVNQVVSGSRPVTGGYRNPFHDAEALGAQELLLRRVVGAFRDHPGIGLWNLGNEPDLFAWPDSATAGRRWVRRWRELIQELDPLHPVTMGLHVESLLQDNGLRVDQIFGEVDLAVMHGYPMYQAWAAGPLDPDFVPFLCALTSALCGKPTLAEEFGGPTVAPGEPSTTWAWPAYGKPREQFIASEEAFAAYIEAVLPRLVRAGAGGALLWCFADYDPALYGRPPCDEAHHERFFGLVRPDGSLKPHARVLQRFASAGPQVQASDRPLALDVTPDEYYQDPAHHAQRLYLAYK